jgi:hypothetical protein
MGTAEKEGRRWRLLTNIAIITSPRARDSNFTEEQPLKNTLP